MLSLLGFSFFYSACIVSSSVEKILRSVAWEMPVGRACVGCVTVLFRYVLRRALSVRKSCIERVGSVRVYCPRLERDVPASMSDLCTKETNVQVFCRLGTCMLSAAAGSPV